ncbi:dethiobiotin synthase [Chitinophaga sancti]|uniref:ATP-dependent dethiobiotin synthetase BioD n=1 Tax=Chitinophaga sancti TaxID=1004 RepID=A0A1K1SB10_9BACT|nr:dethiobiotin synthase [Chitinophaga sancti]WQD63526.1 dethiobiotin synthase [Chitinophaga sancti]WQG90848.1 dethiobiotin synthase [Chitinophaga sancti]SFW81553.1 dethiobiotin synthetase [Chitinophaga sancti]
MTNRIFITGIGTGVGKTITSAIITESLQADYWKPVQTGLTEGTDTDTIKKLLSNPVSKCHREAYCLKEPASPHLAARLEGVNINVKRITEIADSYQPANRPLIIEGAGGLMVPITNTIFTIDLIRQLKASVIIVAGNYLGAINHSLLTARSLQQEGIPVLGWVFSGETHSNEDEVVAWSGFPKLGRIPQSSQIDKAFVKEQAEKLSLQLK